MTDKTPICEAEKAMDVIEELRADVEHSGKCYQNERFHSTEAAKRRAEELGIGLRDCTNECSYRRKLAFLDRLREPTEEMILHALKECGKNGYAWTRGMIDEQDVSAAFQAMLTAAQEGL